MFSRFWVRLGKLGLALLVAYLILAYSLVLTIIVRRELTVLDLPRALAVLGSTETTETSTFTGQVRNVFGDPVPHAVLIVADRLAQADSEGFFSLTDLRPGHYDLEIFAGGYAKYRRGIQLEMGANSSTIKYETGLWPEIFQVDFHIYFKSSHEILGILGFANGTSEPIFVQRAALFDPQGRLIKDILRDDDGFGYYAGLSSKLEVVEEPGRALKWSPHTVQSGEFPPIKGVFEPGLYRLEVHYAFQAEHTLGKYTVLTCTDHLDADNDWNPHLP